MIDLYVAHLYFAFAYVACNPPLRFAPYLLVGISRFRCYNTAMLTASRKRMLTTTRELRTHLHGKLTTVEIYRLLTLLKRAKLAKRVGVEKTTNTRPCHVWSVPTWLKIGLLPPNHRDPD